MNRRQFLKRSGKIILAPYALNGLASLIGQDLLADYLQVSQDQIFLVVRVWGSMDCTLGLNPWLGPRPNENSLYLDTNYEVMRNVKGTGINLGPSAHALADHVQDICVVNGIFMGTVDLGHPFAQNYITTSKSSPDAPHFISEMAECARVRSDKKKETVLFSGEVHTFDLQQIAKKPIQILAPNRYQQNNPNSNQYSAPNFEGNGTLLQGFRAAQNLNGQREAITKLIEELKAKYPVKNESNSNGYGGGNFDNQAEMDEDLTLAAALASGVARFAQVDWEYQSSLDNHTDFKDRHQKNQKHVFDRLSRLLSILKELNLFPNKVTVALLTEFSRPPQLNANNGKDHNYYDNSALIAGRGVIGGQTIGAHQLFPVGSGRDEPQLSGCHIDYSTGQVIQNENFNTADVEKIKESHQIGLIRPENILRTLGDILGADYNLIRLISKNVKPLPGVKK